MQKTIPDISEHNCHLHNKKCHFLCLTRNCTTQSRLLCTQCITKHNQHQIVDYDDFKMVLKNIESNQLASLNQQSQEIWRHFYSSKNKLIALLDSIETSILIQIAPLLYKIKENQNDLNTLAQLLSDAQIDKTSDVVYASEKINTSIALLEELDFKLQWKLSKTLQCHQDVIYSLSLSPDGTKAITGGGDMQIRHWDLVNYQMIGKPNVAHQGVVWCVAYGPNEIISGSDDNTVKYWDHQLKLQDVKHSHDPIFSLKFNETYSMLASGVSNLIYIWQNKQQVALFKGHSDYVTCLDFRQNLLVSGSKDKTVRLWDIQKQQQIKIFMGNQNTIRSVAISADLQYVASGGYDMKVRLWNVATEDMSFYDQGDIVWTVSFLNGTTLVSGGKNAKIKFCSGGEIDCQKSIMVLQLTSGRIVAATNKDICIFQKIV